MVSCEMKPVKYTIFSVNLLLFLIGICTFGAGILACFFKNSYPTMATMGDFLLSPVIVLLVGFIITVVSFLGCCGAARDDLWMLKCYFYALTAIFAFQLILIIIAFCMGGTGEDALRDVLKSSMSDYDNFDKTKHFWDTTQQENQCCGLNGPSDWKKVTKSDSLPLSCCPNTVKACAIAEPTHYTQPCFEKIKEDFAKYLWIFGVVIGGIMISEVVAIGFSWLLAREVKNSRYQH